MAEEKPKEKQEKDNKLLVRRYLMIDIIHGLTFIAILLGALCWMIILFEGIRLAPEYGFIIKDNVIHAAGALFVVIFLVMFPLNYYLRRCGYYFHEMKREVWRKH